MSGTRGVTRRTKVEAARVIAAGVVLIGSLCLVVFLAPAASAVSGNGIVLYVETVPDTPALAASVRKYLREKAEARRPGGNLIRFAGRGEGSNLVLRVEKQSAKMSESDRRSAVFTLHDNEVDRDKRKVFPKGSKVTLDMVVSKLTVSYVYQLQMVVGGRVWDVARLEMPAQTLDYRYGENLRVTGADGRRIEPPAGVYPTREVARFLRNGDRAYVDQMYADALGKATIHLVSRFFGQINAALRDVPFDDPGTRDGILFAERFRKIARLIGRVAPIAGVCGLEWKVKQLRGDILKSARNLSGGRMALGMGVPDGFASELEQIMVSETGRVSSAGDFRDGCTDETAFPGISIFNELADEFGALTASLNRFGDLD